MFVYLAASLQELQTRRTSAPPTLHTLMDRLLGPTSRMLTRTLCRSDEEAWARTCEVCPGSGKGKLYTIEQIDAQRAVIRL